MSQIIKINVPYWTAGKTFNWNNEYKQVGIGLNIAYLIGGGEIDIQVGEKKTIYRITKEKAREIYSIYNSTFLTKTEPRIRLAVIPWEAFKNVGESNAS